VLDGSSFGPGMGEETKTYCRDREGKKIVRVDSPVHRSNEPMMERPEYGEGPWKDAL